MLYLDDQKLPLSEIRNYNGECFFKKDLKALLKNIEHNPPPSGVLSFKYAANLYFKTKGVTKGNVKTIIKEKKRGIRMPMAYVVKTGEGTQNLTWCETATKQGDGFSFKPRNREFKGNWSLHYQRDSEFILFVMTALPEFANGIIVLDNPVKKGDDTAEQRRRMSSLDYHIYNKESVLAQNPSNLKNVALAWGISVGDNVTSNMIKNALYDAVSDAEKNRVKSRNIDAFMEAVNNEMPYMEELVLVQKSDDAGLISYSGQTNQWSLSVGDKARKLVVVPASKKGQRNYVLAKYLSTHGDIVGILEASLNIDGDTGTKDLPPPSSGNKDDGDKNPLSKYNKDTNFEDLKWLEIRSIGHFLKSEVLKKAPILEDIKAYFEKE